MWFTREQFQLCNELRQWGLEPRFEPGDVVARGFADLGFEEFQVLPGPRLLSLTAGTATPLPVEHRGHFCWIPSIDEAIALLEGLGAELSSCSRHEAREWVVELRVRDTLHELRGRSFHDVALKAVLAAYRETHHSTSVSSL
jgi:hypothetical protein